MEIVSDSESVLVDLPCFHCGYNLRTRPVDGFCPECGHAVKDAFLDTWQGRVVHVASSAAGGAILNLFFLFMTGLYVLYACYAHSIEVGTALYGVFSAVILNAHFRLMLRLPKTRHGFELGVDHRRLKLAAVFPIAGFLCGSVVLLASYGRDLLWPELSAAPAFLILLWIALGRFAFIAMGGFSNLCHAIGARKLAGAWKVLALVTCAGFGLQVISFSFILVVILFGLVRLPWYEELYDLMMVVGAMALVAALLGTMFVQVATFFRFDSLENGLLNKRAATRGPQTTEVGSP